MGTWGGRCRWAAALALGVALWLLQGAGGGGGESASAAPATGGVVFGGLTSQLRPIVVRISPRRTRVVRVDWSWKARCTLGPEAPPGTAAAMSWTDSTAPLRFPIAASGRWASGRYETGPFTDPATGVSETFTYRLTGIVQTRGTRMTGTIRASYVERTPAGVVRSCTSGVIRYAIQD